MSGTLVHPSPSRFHFEYPCCEPIAEIGGQRPRQRRHDWPAVFALLWAGEVARSHKSREGVTGRASASEERDERVLVERTSVRGRSWRVLRA